MHVTLLRSKIHKATITHCHLDYEGSLGIDVDFLEACGMLPYEKILVGNISNGKRFETYAIPEERGSKMIRLNGAAAHLGQPGDLLVIMSFCQIPYEEARAHKPRVLVLGPANQTMEKVEEKSLEL